MAIIKDLKQDNLKKDLKKDIITAFEIKLELLKYYRYKRNCICATEFALFSGVSDIIVYDLKKNLIDIEVKISKSDFKADFNKDKHRIFNKTINRYKSKTMPNKFMFCVTEDLKEFALEYLKDYPLYGLLVIEENIYRNKVYYNIKTVKRAKKLHNKPIDKKLLTDKFLLKLNSEVICRAQQIVKLKGCV